MTKKLNFEKVWKDAKELGMDLEGFAEELVEAMKKEGISEQLQIRIVEVFAEIDALIDFVCETKLGIDPFKKWHRNKFLKHAHNGDKILVPETEPNTEE